MTSASTGTTEDDVRRQEGERVAALLAHDAARFTELADERLVVTHSTGLRQSGRAFADALGAGHLRYERLDQAVDGVVLDGDAAVVTGRMDADLHAGGTTHRVRSLSTSVWVHRPAGWRLLSFQTTTAAPTAPSP